MNIKDYFIRGDLHVGLIFRQIIVGFRSICPDSPEDQVKIGNGKTIMDWQNMFVTGHFLYKKKTLSSTVSNIFPHSL